MFPLRFVINNHYHLLQFQEVEGRKTQAATTWAAEFLLRADGSREFLGSWINNIHEAHEETSDAGNHMLISMWKLAHIQSAGCTAQRKRVIGAYNKCWKYLLCAITNWVGKRVHWGRQEQATRVQVTAPIPYLVFMDTDNAALLPIIKTSTGKSKRKLGIKQRRPMAALGESPTKSLN
jgi:hypothetical protein